eukprot:1261937-Prymnesium_polylepis.1
MDHLHATRAFDPAPLQPSPTLPAPAPQRPSKAMPLSLAEREYAACHLHMACHAFTCDSYSSLSASLNRSAPSMRVPPRRSCAFHTRSCRSFASTTKLGLTARLLARDVEPRATGSCA